MIVDFLGREIAAGGYIVYPVRRGSQMWLTKLRVTQVNSGKTPSVVGFNDAGRRIVIKNLANVVVIQPVNQGV